MISANLNRISGVAYLLVLAFLSILSGRYAVSNYFAQASLGPGFLEEAVRGIRFQPENPHAHEALGLGLERQNEFRRASDSFEGAVALSPNDYRLWLSLAKARSLSGEESASEAAYRHAIELAPGYSLPNIEFGRMYLAFGHPDKAFEFLGAAARFDQSYYAEVLKLANHTFGDDPDAIERAVAPASTKGKSIVAWYFLDRGWMTEKTHAFLISDEPLVEDKNTVIRFLKEKRNYTLAREVWLSRLAAEGVPIDASSELVDGGFESITENDPSGFGWQVDQEIPSVSIALAHKDAHSGDAALNIKFAGNVELRRPIVSQIASVEPGKKYTLTFFFLARDLVSAGLPAILVTDPATNAIFGRYDLTEDTKGAWVQRSITFASPKESAALVSFQRPECSSQPCPIFGEVSLDDLSVSPAGH